MPGSGIFGTFGYALESAWATYTTPNHFITFEKEAFASKKGTSQAKDLHGGLYNLASRRAYTKKGATGSVDAHLFDRALGGLFKLCFGSVAVSGSGTTGYTQVYTPADTTGLSGTVQIGRPMTNNTTIQPMSYVGCKVTDFTIDAKSADFTTFSVNFDAQQEETSPTYVAPSYVASNMLTSVEATLIIGGTASTTSGVTSVTGGTTITLAKDVSIKHNLHLDTDRFFLGSALKQEQIVNDVREITGNLTLQFNDLSTVYTAFAADTSVALQLNITGPQMVGTANNSAVNILIPSVWWDEDKFPVSGPQTIEQQVTFTGLDDGVNNPIQLTYVTLDPTP